VTKMFSRRIINITQYYTSHIVNGTCVVGHSRFFNQISSGLDVVGLAAAWLTATANTDVYVQGEAVLSAFIIKFQCFLSLHSREDFIRPTVKQIINH